MAERARWHEVAGQATSARWRGQLKEWSALVGPLEAAGAATASAVTITSETINFFADTGRLQISVVNNLDVGLRNVGVRLAPLNGRLRLDSQPESR